MTEIRFYHLGVRSVADALPDLLGKALAASHRVAVRTGDAAEVERLNDHLWTYRPDSFLPHGAAKDGFGADQPIWLTDGADTPNGAQALFLLGQAEAEDIGAFALCCFVFDDHDEATVGLARARWKAWRDAGHAITYWKQTENGWTKQA